MRFTIGMTGILALTVMGAVSPAGAQTLSEALAAAYQFNPTLAAARDELKATDEQLAQAQVYWWRPTLSATLQEGRQWIDQRTDDQFVNGGVQITDVKDHSTQREINLEGEIYLWRGGQTLAAIDNARSTIIAQEAVLAATEMTTLSNVSSYYADVVLELVNLQLANQNEDDLNQLWTMVEDMLASQRATVGDIAQVNLSLAENEDSRLTTEALLQNARSSFHQLTGIYPTTLEHWPALPAPPENLETALAIAGRENPRIAAALAEVNANEAAVREDEGALLPTISITTNYTLEFDKTRFDHSAEITEHTRESTASVLLQLSIPLYDGGLNYSYVREAKFVVAQSRSKLLETQLDVKNDATMAWQTLGSAERRINVSIDRWSAASDALASEQRLFQQGQSTIRDVIDSQNDIISAQQAMEQAYHDAFVAHVGLLVAMGRFDAFSLELPVTHFDPDAYLDEMQELPLGIGLE
ncbi:MAG: TolC family protein [Alphaproteobacteria bacterium]|nr:TolC family protein [Alphaproteobacteria bacterium]